MSKFYNELYEIILMRIIVRDALCDIEYEFPEAVEVTTHSLIILKSHQRVGWQ